jgi:probable H4MPT-linked C1 transfer pathway protein
MNGPILGWDVGGANVKAARYGGDAAARAQVVECPFALWRDPGRLPTVLTDTANRLGGAPTMAVTMTAELADCFATKREGVGFVLDAFHTAFPDIEPWIYGVDGQFRSPLVARQQPEDVAAANWMASASFLASMFPNALFLDVGSTTTDIIPIVAGRVAVRGRTDTQRLQTGELVYTGALRTPICAIVRSVPVHGRACRIAAEHFAIAADVHLWLGHIDERDYTCDTPDGRGRSRGEAGARIARMVCADLDVLGPDEITAIAEHLLGAQVREIACAIREVRRGVGSAFPNVAILAGQGAFLARRAATEIGLPDHSVAQDVGPAVARATPAAAVAYLLAATEPRTGTSI